MWVHVHMHTIHPVPREGRGIRMYIDCKSKWGCCVNACACVCERVVSETLILWPGSHRSSFTSTYFGLRRFTVNNMILVMQKSDEAFVLSVELYLVR